MKRVFISFAGSQRNGIAKPLAECLMASNLTVWYDEYELLPGDDVLNIDRGINNCDFGIVVLSKDYMSRANTKYELERLMAKKLESAEKRFLIVVWHEVSVEEVRDFSEDLANIVGVPSSLGVKSVCHQILFLITHNSDLVLDNLGYSVNLYQNRYYFKPDLIDGFIGYRFSRGLTWKQMNDLLRSREIIIATFYNQVLIKVATHIFSPNRMSEIHSLWKPVEYHAVDITKINQGFDKPIEEIYIQQLKDNNKPRD